MTRTFCLQSGGSTTGRNCEIDRPARPPPLAVGQRRSLLSRAGERAFYRVAHPGALVLARGMRKSAFALAGASVLALPAAASAHDFSCRNRASEIRCEAGECRAETDSFTPMHLARAGPLITLCAYSGCWEGRVRFERSRSGVHFVQGDVRRNGSAAQADSSLLSIMHSSRDGTAQINWNGFFNVLTCESRRVGSRASPREVSAGTATSASP